MASLRGFTIAETFEARKSLEMAIAGLAADRATGEQLAQMSEEIAEMFASLMILLNTWFTTCASIKRLPPLRESYSHVVNEYARDASTDVRSKTVSRAKDLKESAEMHRNIYSAIRDAMLRPPPQRCAIISCSLRRLRQEEA